MTEFNRAKLISEVLEEVYPDEIDIVGPAVVDDLISQRINFQGVKEGSKLDTSEIFNLIASSVTFVTALLQLYLVWRTEKKKAPTKEDLMDEANKRKIIPTLLSHNDIENTTITLIDKLTIHVKD